MTEQTLHKQICQYIKLQHPNIIFNTDLSGLKLTMGQAVQAKKLRSSNGFTDIMIFETTKYKFLKPSANNHFPYYNKCGLFLEVKKETPYTKKGALKKMKRYEKINGSRVEYDHLERQNDMHNALRQRGYEACFTWTLEMTIDIIENYLKQ